MISLVEPGDTRLGMAPGEPLLLAMVQGLGENRGPRPAPGSVAGFG